MSVRWSSSPVGKIIFFFFIIFTRSYLGWLTQNSPLNLKKIWQGDFSLVRQSNLVGVICGHTNLPFFPRLVDWLNRKLVYSKLESKLQYQLNFCPMANVLKSYAKMHSDASCMCPICPKIRSSKCLLGEL